MQDLNFELEKALEFNIKELAKAIKGRESDRQNYINRSKARVNIDAIESAIKDIELFVEKDDIIQVTIKNKKVLTAKIIKELR